MTKLTPSPDFGDLRLLGAFVHLSDIHSGHGDASWQANQRMVLTELERDVRGLDTKGIPAPQAIFVSGDLGARGGKDESEYKQVSEFLNKICNVLSLSANNSVLLVPGNHDVRRTLPSERHAFRLLRSLREGAESVDDALVAGEDEVLLRNRFADYTRFAEAFMPGLDGDHFLSWSQDAQLGDELQVRVVGMNTALLSNGDQDETQLRLGMRQIELIQEEIGTRLLITMTHHPLSWLDAKNAREIEGWQLRYAHMHLHGHIHVANASSVRWASGQQLVTVVAGAVHEEQKPPGVRASHGYHVIALCAAKNGQVIARVYPREFSFNEKLFKVESKLVIEGQLFGELPLKFHLRLGGAPAPTPRPGTTTDADLRMVAQSLYKRAGRRRTAYPIDFSIEELANRNLLVPSPLSDRSMRGSTSARTGVEVVQERLEAGESVLVLGAPGGGKTVFAFELADSMLRRSVKIPLFVDLRSFAANGVALTHEVLLRTLLMDTAHAAQSFKDVSGSCLIVDGVDERIVAGESAGNVANVLAALSQIAPIMVTCRADDYERMLAAVIRSDMFSRIFDVLPWSLEHEFADFVSRLAEQRLVQSESVMTLVRQDKRLAKLVERPLFARMLTYVIDGAQLPKSRTELYRQYLDKLGRTTDAALRAAACYQEPRALALWRHTAWTIFDQRIGSGDDVPLAALLSDLGRAGLSADCAYRLLAALMDIETSRGRMTASFIHFSFFEFLVAEHLAICLTAGFRSQSAEAIAALGQHLPQEIRRHLVRILQGVISDRAGWGEWLAKLYKAARDLSDDKRRTAANMLAYLACRLDVDTASVLRRLLGEESDPMLQNSLSWALARLGVEDATWLWLQRLNSEPELSSLNRGYLLYYFGDLKKSAPPYYDDAPYIDCTYTRAKLFEKFRDEVSDRPVARKAVDLFSYLDLLVVRSEKVRLREQSSVKEFATNLYSQIDLEVGRILRDKLVKTE